jgi:hypothetical protein
MTEQEKGTEKVVEETTEQPVPAVEDKKPENPEDTGEETVTIPKKEFDTKSKKAADFDGMVEKNRLKKLASKDAPPATKPEGSTIDEEALVQKAEEAGKAAADARITEFNKSTYEVNLATAFSQFTKKHPWANTDERIDQISNSFKRGSALTVEELSEQLDRAALENFPSEYTKSLEDKVRSKVLAEDSNIQAGGTGAGTGVPPKGATGVDVSKATPKDIKLAEKYFGGDVERYLKTKVARDNA